MIKYVQLKQKFDTVKMQQEVCGLEEKLWKQHYNKSHYEGNWSVLPLRSINGSLDNTVAIHASSMNTNTVYKNTSLLDGCNYIGSVIDFFECEKTAVRLMKLNAGAIIKVHTDYEMSVEEGEARFHIPVITNSHVEFFIEEEKIPMKEGECWYLNLSLKHRVNNFGNADRVHLVIDCKVNAWIENLFLNKTAVKMEISNEPARQEYPLAEKLKIIGQLRLMNTSVANELADKMEAGL